MAGRKHNINIPNLYCKLDKRTSRVYWQYRDPITGKFFSLGTDAEQAKRAADLANRADERRVALSEILDLKTQVEALERVYRITTHSQVIPVGHRPPGATLENPLGTNPSLKAWRKKYESIIKRRLDRKEIVLKTADKLLHAYRVLVDATGDTPASAINTRTLAQLLDGYIDSGRVSMAQSLRSSWTDIFKELQHAGDVPPGYNPALATKRPQTKVTRQRLQLDEWRKIYSVAPQPLKSAMLIALMTGQRRGDVVKMKHADIWDGLLHVEQSKSGNRIAIPLDLYCAELGMTLRDAIEICKSSTPSPYIVNYAEPSRGVRAGSCLSAATLTLLFSTARDSAGIKTAPGKTPATFHEIRSLAERTYSKQKINTQNLLGHSSQKMTDVYHDSRDDSWLVLAI